MMKIVAPSMVVCALALLGCPPDRPALPGGPPPEYEPPRTYDLGSEKAPAEPEVAPPPPLPTPPPSAASTSSAAPSASPTPAQSAAPNPDPAPEKTP